jgi:hypothetical protein
MKQHDNADHHQQEKQTPQDTLSPIASGFFDLFSAIASLIFHKLRRRQWSLILIHFFFLCVTGREAKLYSSNATEEIQQPAYLEGRMGIHFIKSVLWLDPVYRSLRILATYQRETSSIEPLEG